jgi:hypothetical protein
MVRPPGRSVRQGPTPYRGRIYGPRSVPGRYWLLPGSGDKARPRRADREPTTIEAAASTRCRDVEALNLLRSVCDQFTEGFDTLDLLDAKAIMNGMNPRSIAKRNGVPKKQPRGSRMRGVWVPTPLQLTGQPCSNRTQCGVNMQTTDLGSNDERCLRPFLGIKALHE